MKDLTEKISKWAHLSFYHKQFSRHLHLKFEKEVIFLGRFSPYEISESGDKISKFCPLKSKYLSFQNCFLNSYLPISLQPLDRKS